MRSMFLRVGFSMLIFTCLILSINGQNVADKFEDANDLFSEGNYVGALSSYNALISEGVVSANLYNNIGICNFHIAQTGKAILWFERALKISPGRRDIKNNLRIAKDLQEDSFAEVQELIISVWWSNVYNLFPSNYWALFGIIFFAFSLTGLYFRMFGRKMSLRAIGLFAFIFGLIFSLLCISASIQRNKSANDKSYGIVIIPLSNLYKSPEMETEIFSTVHQGLKVKIIDELQSRYFIRLPDGDLVWIDKHDLEII